MDPVETLGLHAAILAVGRSTRFGSPRQLLRLESGLVLHRVVANAANVTGHSVTVVLGAHAREVAPALRLSSASVVLNRDWDEGLASMIRAAVRGTPPCCEALLLLLADQVAVSGEDLQRLYAAWRRHPILIAAALHGGAPGLPAIFPRWAFTDLLELRGDRDAGQALRRNMDRVVRVPMPNAGLALDTAEDLLALGAAVATDGRP